MLSHLCDFAYDHDTAMFPVEVSQDLSLVHQCGDGGEWTPNFKPEDLANLDHLLVLGHASNTGTVSGNLALGKERAESVAGKIKD